MVTSWQFSQHLLGGLLPVTPLPGALLPTMQEQSSRHSIFEQLIFQLRVDLNSKRLGRTGQASRVNAVLAGSASEEPH